jgi:hypothetical protein
VALLVKTHFDGSFECYKARLVARGFHREQDYDYDETFVPVAHMKIIRARLVVIRFVLGPSLNSQLRMPFLVANYVRCVYSHHRGPLFSIAWCVVFDTPYMVLSKAPAPSLNVSSQWLLSLAAHPMHMI